MRAWLGLALTLTACGGDKDTDTTDTTDTDTETDGTETGTTASGPSFEDVYQDILKPSCALAGCHAVGSGNGMELSDSGAYAALINQPAIDAPGEILVIPGDADGSYLVKKLEDASGIIGDPMPPPFGTQPLEDIAAIREWIDAGANP